MVVAATVEVHGIQGREEIVDKPPFVSNVSSAQDTYEVKLFNDSHELLAHGNQFVFAELCHATRIPGSHGWPLVLSSV